MLEIDAALKIVLDNTPVLRSETVDLDRALGLALAEDLLSPEPIPLFDSSAMDGFAVHSGDVAGADEQNPVTLKIAALSRAGEPYTGPVPEGTAVKIMTGAVVPSGADAVVMKEYVDEQAGTILVKRAALRGDHIRRRGEEFAEGQTALDAGTLVTPPVIGLLATLGFGAIAVRPNPAVSIIVTGSELKSPGEELKRGQIRDANTPALVAALRAIGIEPVSAERVADDGGTIASRLAAALESSDVTITVGGVSVGDFDLVKDVAEEIGVETLFWRIAMKPGKPNYFGKKGDSLLFGLPGNPVSALVSFHQLVKPALRAMAGRTAGDEDGLGRACLVSELRKRTHRLEFVRGRLGRNDRGEMNVLPLLGQESHKLGALARADCLILFPQDVNFLEAGSMVDVETLDWSTP